MSVKNCAMLRLHTPVPESAHRRPLRYRVLRNSPPSYGTGTLSTTTRAEHEPLHVRPGITACGHSKHAGRQRPGSLGLGLGVGLHRRPPHHRVQLRPRVPLLPCSGRQQAGRLRRAPRPLLRLAVCAMTTQHDVCPGSRAPKTLDSRPPQWTSTSKPLRVCLSNPRPHGRPGRHHPPGELASRRLGASSGKPNSSKQSTAAMPWEAPSIIHSPASSASCGEDK